MIILALLGSGALLAGCDRPSPAPPPTASPLPATATRPPAPPTRPAATPTRPATSTLAPTPAPTLTPTSAPGITRTHTVQSGESLGQIALDYDVSIEALAAANDLDSPDEIWAGQELVIPPAGVIAAVTPAPAAEAPPTSSPEDGTPAAPPATAAAEAPWTPSILEGDLARAYPVTREEARYTLHYPAAMPEAEQDAARAMVETAIAHIEQTLAVHLEGQFDAYGAGSLFAPPDMALRGRSFSSQRRFFFLWDGTGDAADRQYIITHEATHTFTWNTMGRPVSVMLHEGVAVFTGMAFYEAAGYIPLDDFCAIFRRAGKLPLPSAAGEFGGHIADLETYYSAGSFVRYLIETYGAASFATLYTTGDYNGVYGKSGAALEAEWLARLDARAVPTNIDGDALIAYVARIKAAYPRLFAAFDGAPAELRAYRALDQARLAVLSGRFPDAEQYLAEFEAAMAQGE